MLMAGLYTRRAVQRINERSGSIDDHPAANVERALINDVRDARGPDAFVVPVQRIAANVIDRRAAAIQRIAHEVEDEASVVVGEIRIRVLDAAA